ncbi:NADH:flavin oxidoreductase/NADH oxidase [Paenibacillus sp. MMS18-CY102]|uniref:NADH:flavin oxidoreductase/NADH oxidase n=1 Tax=Paenibacillus sp. MMS18-CY102 TaxID=2682849 RepID=UPI00136585EF|nr:NADH:flavin oxidoreductase/NADH oxidase [Paenibacillus sp. MMS18-CY102]MWC30283.1 NADPH dehydrogenase [Paenibacillus sp. MMS18-CY102]
MSITLSTPFEHGRLQLRNRIVMPPMCQYSAENNNGMPTDWHDVHYVSRAVGGTGLIVIEMTDIEPDGRISEQCLGLWSDEQIPAFARMIERMKRHSAKVGIQIAHAGRKSNCAQVPVSSSNAAFSPAYKQPRALSTDETKQMVERFRDAVSRAVQAGVDTIQLHGAHGYLIHQFHSPSINDRTDQYGTDDPTRFGVEIIQAARSVLPSHIPLQMRVSAVDYGEGGYDLAYGVELCRKYQAAGVELFDISTGGGVATSPVMLDVYPGYQLPMARAVKQATGLPVIAVGLLDEPKLAQAAVANGDCDLVAVGRGMLRDPYWALHAQQATGSKAEPPKPYLRGY